MNDLELKSLLQELAVMRSEGEPIVSLYLDTAWTDEQQRERARVFVREASKHELETHEAHPQYEQLERTMRRLEGEAGDRATQQGERNGKSVAIFACEALNLWRVLELPHGLENKLCTGMRPQLLPLVRLVEDVEPAYIVVVHANGARIYETALGGIVAESTIEGPVPRSYQSGGFMPRPALGRIQVPGNPRGVAQGFQYERTDKNQRHYKNKIQQNLEAAAGFLVQRFDQHPCHVVLVGPREKTAAFERTLPPRVAERIISRRPEPMGAGRDNPSVRDQILEQALEALAKKEREQEELHVEQALGQAKRGGLAVLGPDEVVMAVNERRVHRLILEEGFAGSGWMCRNCDAIGITHADKCTFCQGDLAWVKELGEELASRVMADDGEVEIVPRDRRLHSYRGVAAMLRQARGGFGMNERHAAPTTPPGA